MAIKINGTNTTANPGITGPDTDTGLVYGTDQVQIVTGGATRATVDSSGNLGVGTAAPSQKLHVENTSGVAGLLVEGSNLAQIILSDNNGGTNDKNVVLRNSQQNLLFGTQDDSFSSFSESLRLDKSGNLGIGVTSVNSSRRVEIKQPSSYSAAIRILADGNGNDGNLQWFSGSSQYEIGVTQATDALKFKRDNSEKMRLDSSGRLLVGTTTEGAAAADNLTIADSSNVGITLRSGASNNGAIYFSDATSGDGEFGGYVQYEHNNRQLRFGTASTSVMLIDSSGRVAIGETNPDYQLCVSDTGVVRAKIACTNNHGAGAGVYLKTLNSGAVVSNATLATDNAGNFKIFTGTSSEAERLRILPSGGITFNGDTAAANALDDYEEGTWTPVINKAGTSGSITSYAARYGNYRKVGNLLFLSFYAYASSGSFGTGGNQWYISGLPYSLVSLQNSAYQFISGGYLGINGKNYNFAAGSGTGTASGSRWQANSVNGPATLSMYGVEHNTNWSSGGLEMSGSGVLMTQ